ncbi:disease resistance protein RUN1-like isoform X1 [Macadamia integrifolia]|uniref:disease resistance protein RUN1-like isoform X1 n=1 Tax=Macadamia integrifolia TaxID=60698 RepID=UPI001C4FFC82|nr:disease resistance protein RUN1-like isoform X1 [Macadamia integrifolia]XP_042482264.1 disease resistance protein RUN1-like isoform X1 [Macadamia integrifolia]XP_042482265.1 disease resistance protein RUN1-like isoform X1 [Macadamia integrifolia]
MTKLRLLQVDYAKIAEKIVHSPSFPELRWLSWKRCPIKFTPTNLSKLCVLDLSDSDITESWMGWKHIKVEKNLKVLNLCHCVKLSQLLDVSANLHLEELILENCSSLTTIGASIGHLKSLTILNVKGCKRLEHLSTSIGQLSSLKTLDIRRTNICQLPEALGSLEALTELYVGFSKIQLPSSTHHLRNLKTLSGAHDIIPQAGRYSIPPNHLPELPSSLKYLDASFCKMKSLTTLSKLTDLEVLYLDYCENLLEVPTTINSLTRLEKLSILNCYKLAKIGSLEGLVSLQHLEICYCGSLKTFPKLRGLKKLRYLELSNDVFIELEGLEGLYSLEKLIIKYCYYLRKIPNLSDLKNVVCIEIRVCPESPGIEGLEGLNPLQELIIKACVSWRKIKLPKELRMLHILKLKNLSEIEGLEGLDSLKQLYIRECPSLRKIQLPKKLRELEIQH